MSSYGGAFRRLNPLTLQVIASLIGAVLLVVVAFRITSTVTETSKHTQAESQAAILASEIRSDVLQLRALEAGIDEVGSWTPGHAMDAHDLARAIEDKAEAIVRLAGSQTALEIWGVSGEAHVTLDQYIDNPSTANQQQLLLTLAAMQSLVDHAVPVLTEEALADHSTLVRAALVSRAVSILVAGLVVGGISVTAFLIGRRLRTSLSSLERERDNLSATTQGLNRRSEQLSALYNIVTEVTDSLSLKYVVDTTVREAKKLVNADLVVLRLLRDSNLEVVGMSQVMEPADAHIETITLGEGLVGRAAKRGKTTRIDRDAEGQMTGSELILGVESGVVVPLIVGARVVGTLGCWSIAPDHFNADDERILEMMASQVATAVVAAEMREVSDEMAHQDPLTGLPNRRQLAKDVAGRLRDLTAGDEPFAVAMVDIDHFKNLNDEFGHRVGDVTLQKVAEVLRSSLRDRDLVYRFGGEEFVIVFSNVTQTRALVLAERARKSVEQTPLTGRDLEPVGPVTVSIGLALFPRHSGDFEELVNLADMAMYASKEAGRNVVTVYSGDKVASAA